MSANTIVVLAEFLIFKAVQSQYYYSQPSYPSYYSGYSPSYYAQPYSPVPPEVVYSRPDSISAETPSASPQYVPASPSQPTATRTYTTLDPSDPSFSYSYPVSSTSLSNIPSPISSTSSYSGFNPTQSAPSLIPVPSTVSYPTQQSPAPSNLLHLPSSQSPSFPPGSQVAPQYYPNPSSPYYSHNSEGVPNYQKVPYQYQYPAATPKPSIYLPSTPTNAYLSPSNYTYAYPYYREDIPVHYSNSPHTVVREPYKEEVQPPVYNCPFCNGFKDVKPPPGKNIPPPPPTISEQRQDCPCKYEQRDLEADHVYRYESPGMTHDAMPRQYLYSSQDIYPQREYQQCPETQRYQHPEQHQKLEDQQYRPILSYSDYENRMIPTHREEKKSLPKPQELFKTLIAEIESRLPPKLKKSERDTRSKYAPEDNRKLDKFSLIPKEYDILSRCKECSSQNKEDTRSRRERSGLATSEPSSRRPGFNQPPTVIDSNYFEEDTFSRYTGESSPIRNSRPDLELLDAFMSCVGKP